MVLLEVARDRIEVRRVGSREEGEHVARLGQEPFEHGAGDLAERLTRRDRVALDEAEKVALADRESIELGVARGDRDGSRGQRLERSEERRVGKECRCGWWREQ